MKRYAFCIIGWLLIISNQLSAQKNNGDKEKTTEPEVFYEYDVPAKDLQSTYKPWQEKYIGKIVFSNYRIQKDTIDETKLKTSFYGDEEINLRYFCKKEFSCAWRRAISVKVFIDGKWVRNMFSRTGLFDSGCHDYTETQAIQSVNHIPNNSLSKGMLVHFKALAEGKHIIKLEIGCEEESAKDGSMIAEATGEFEFIVTKHHLPPAQYQKHF